MRRWTVLFTLGVLACIAAGCDQNQGSSAQAVSQNKAVNAAPRVAPASSGAPALLDAAARGPNQRFYAVQAKLDQGGSFYLYSDLKGSFRAFMDQVKPVVSGPGMPPEAMRIYAIADQVLNRLGIFGLHDLGISVVPDGALNRTKMYVSAPEGRQQGILSILGGSPHPLAALDRASSGTLVLIDADYDSAAAWKLVRQLAQDIGGVEGTTRIDQGLAQARAATGLDLEAINASLGGECILALDQDPAAMMMVPLPPAPLTLKAPRLTLMIRVKDSKLYEGLKFLIAQHAGPQARPEATEGKLKIVELALPPNPFWPVVPALATDGEFVYLSTNLAHLRQLAVPTGPLLRDGLEFRSLSAKLPTAANGMAFCSPRLGKVLQEVFQGVAAAQARSGAPANPFLNRFSAQMDQSFAGALTLRINEPDGVMMISRSKSGAAQYMPAMLVAPAAILAAIAVPNFLEAQGRAKVSRVKADMRTMSLALETYYIDQNVYPAWTAEPGRKIYGSCSPSDQPGFRVKSSPSDPLMTLTTPIAYISQFYKDPLAPSAGATFSYWTPPQESGIGYILWSPGPDGRYDLNLNNVPNLYVPKSGVPSPGLVDLTYDPSNGTKSAGDIWRIKE